MKLRSWMMLGVGYVLGSKAGQERYQELRGRLSELAASPAVTDAMARARQNLGLPSQSASSTTDDQGPRAAARDETVPSQGSTGNGDSPESQPDPERLP